MPYIVAASLQAGAFSEDMFAPERFTDPKVLALADKITIREADDINRDFPAKLRCRVEMTTNNGATVSAGVDYPHGHHLDPMSDAEVEAKFRDLASRKLSPAKVDAALAALWAFDQAASADAIFAAVRIETDHRP
jgi:2-methylcitrate dehydratase